MKKYLLPAILLLLMTAAVAQSKKKPSMNDKPPTQKEIEAMMKEMQKAMDEMSPEDKKMMDSMGIKMPSMNSIPKVSDKQLADAWEEEARLVPKKDAARIATILPAPAMAALPAFILKVHNAVLAKLSTEEREDAETVNRSVK